MTTDNRLKLTHLIKKLTDESVEQLLETACKLFAANMITQRPDCPYCQSSSIVKNGHKCGKQEYRCKECRKTFVSTTNTLMSNSHQSSETWEELIQDTISGESISYSAKRLSISHDCAFHMELMKMMFPAKEVVERLRKEYPVGCRIVLDSMNDPYHHIPAGAQGECHGVDDAGSVMVAWDCGSSLSVAYGADRAHRVASEEEVKKSLDWLGKRQRKAAGGGHCPRCGAPLESFARHALSRRADIIICDADGTAEAFEDAGMAPRMSLTQWWCVQNNWKL